MNARVNLMKSFASTDRLNPQFATPVRIRSNHGRHNCTDHPVGHLRSDISFKYLT